MTYLLDTNIVSEHSRRLPDAGVVRWLRGIALDAQYISVLTLGEIRFGIERLNDGSRRDRLRVWLEEDLVPVFGDRLLPVSAAVAERWARIRVEVGRSVPTIDSLLAATALHHDLRLVTRNEADYSRFSGLVVVNPWRH